jgi:hypothetical protein
LLVPEPSVNVGLGVLHPQSRRGDGTVLEAGRAAYGRGAEVSTSSSAKRRQFWRSDGFVGVWIVVALLVLCESTGPQGAGRFAAELRSVVVQLGGPAAASTSTAPGTPTSMSLASVPRTMAEKKVWGAAGHLPTHAGGDAFASSYDPAAKPAGADHPFARTAVFGRPDGPAHPRGGAGQSGSDA